MNTSNLSDLPVRLALQVDAVCARFEAAWKTAATGGARPQLAEYLTDVDGSVRPVLAQELLRVEAHYRRRAGDEPRAADYGTLLHDMDPVLLATALAAGPMPPVADGQITADRRLLGWDVMPAGDMPAVPGYEVLSELGSGGMGVVYKARQIALNRLVALKMILAGGLAKPRELERFRREAEAVAQLQHPNIVQIYEIGEYGRRPFLALEYVDGVSLDERFVGFPQPARAAAQLVETVARAMHYAHERGIIHRDLKPANVLLAGSRPPVGTNRAERARSASLQAVADNLVPKITDFGLAKLIDSDVAGPTRSGDVLGTPSYMAPEQAAGKPGTIGPGTDVYGLGTILYEMLTGHPPFRAESALDTLLLVRSAEPVSPTRLQPKCPRDLETICLKCLEKDPVRRYASAQTLADDLRRFLAGEPIRARPVGTLERARKWVRRRPGVAALLAAFVIVTVVSFVSVVRLWQKTATALTQSQQAKDALQAHFYLSQISLAQHELQANHVGRAEHLLDDSPPAARGWEWRYLKRLCQTTLFTMGGNGSPVQSVAYSPDGLLLASGSGDWYTGRDGELNVWDARTGKLVRSLPQGPGTVYGVAFHPDGRRLAATSADGKVRIWDARAGQLLHTLPGHSNRIDCVAFSPDGRRVASGSRDQTVRVWDVETGTSLHELKSHQASIWGLAFSPDGRRLVSSDRDGMAFLWDPVAGTVVRTFGGFDDIRSAAFHPDGSRLAFAHYSGIITLYDLTRPDSSAVVLHPNAGPLLSLVFTPNGGLAWSSREGHVRIQDARTGQDRNVFRGHDGWAYAVAVSPDGRRLATAGWDGVVRICDATVQEEPARYLDDGAELPGLMFDAAGRLHAMGSIRETSATVWEMTTRTKLFSLPDQTNLTAAAGSPDGRFWAWVGGDQVLRVRDRAGKAEVWSRTLAAAPVTGLAYSADGRLLAWGGADGLIRLCDAETGREVRTIGPHKSPVTGVAFDYEGRLIASAGADGTFCLWSLASGQLATLFGDRGPNAQAERPKASVTRLAFSPDGRRLAVANPRRPLEIWDVTAGRVALILDWDAEGASSAAWSADGRLLAAGLGKRVKVWDAAEQTIDERRAATVASPLAWHRAETLAAWQRADWFAAIHHLDRLIEAEPAVADHFLSRGTARARQTDSGRARREDAIADLAKAIELGTNDYGAWYWMALLALDGGDLERYRSVCALLYARFGRTTDPQLVNDTAWTFTLADGALPDANQFVEYARRAVTAFPKDANSLNTLGAALYRAGRYEDARQRFVTADKLRPPGGNVWDWLYLAMIHQRLGQPEEARRWLNKARPWLDPTASDLVPPGSRTLVPWEHHVELRLLGREALGLVGG